MGTLVKIRRLYFRDKQSIKEICRQTGIARNTVRTWLREPGRLEPKYPVRAVVSKLDAYRETLSLWLKADSGRGKRERRTKGQMWQALCDNCLDIHRSAVQAITQAQPRTSDAWARQPCALPACTSKPPFQPVIRRMAAAD